MNDEQIKFLLGACRSGDRDATDPAVAEALAAVERDPRLRAWFEREQAFGGAVREKLREVAPPAALREAILAGARLGGRTPWWRRATTLALAASVALLLTLAPVAWRLARPSAADTLPEFALNFAGRGFIGLQEHNPDVEKLKAWLAMRQAPLPAKIPWELAQLRGLGCRTVDFQGKNISIICFERDREYHLFVARREDFPGLPAAAEPRFASRREWGSAVWSDAHNHYVLVSDAGLPAVKRLL
ncbi:MAG TPA: hypothetical protein VHO24_15500 [Opitutaceae bacterium]|nr:hypothetical protein [Opitutaceae bacterium]